MWPSVAAAVYRAALRPELNAVHANMILSPKYMVPSYNYAPKPYSNYFGAYI